MALKNQRGQTVVEYILLLSVAMSLVVTFYRSSFFQKMFGDEGQVGKLFKYQGEWEYRHAIPWKSTNVSVYGPYPGAKEHPSYFPDRDGKTHFFGPSDPYQ
jgi:hypothetical protein